ncbi:glycoside hydrolase family 88 protein [Albibacterium bauzanense]|uniref:Glycosyl hydrolase family 88 n=1 Tax=Albibacterium bauzanense TaxID=653929 RepID=A0A4R1M3X2_9SPHI|nr:glycoside hydrolase family 88 protein [Albibacterium bauzanense]TCK85574.1 glycosyl hydrolase family 88 [Albibacterium bauzanense]
MKVKLMTALCFLLINSGMLNAQVKDQKMGELIDQQFKFADQQYKVLAKNLPADVMPKTYNATTDKVVTSNTAWWCSGFFPGSLFYIYEYTQDAEILAEAKRRLTILEKEKNNKGTHDLGFMMYCSFGNAYRLLHDPAYKDIIEASAASLSTRYHPAAKVIQSWNSSDRWVGPVIIDNMMNLELLSWVSDHDGDKKYKEIAVNHANSTIKNHYRPDYSAYHVLDYNMETGEVLKKVNWQGYADESAWSRGQAWGLYGFTMMYRFTKDKQYLDQAIHIANFMLNDPNMPADMIPYWDYDAPEIPNTYRDASAGAIMASALLELAQYSNKAESKKYLDASEKAIRTLASDTYRSKLGENGGFLLKHGVGFLGQNSEVDVPLTYGDYYFLEALHRYKEWYL